MIFISVIDVKTGFDEEAYKNLESLTPDGEVTPLLIGRIFEESDILLLLHSENLVAVDVQRLFRRHGATITAVKIFWDIAGVLGG